MNDLLLGIRKYDDELQVVYGEVYSPNVPDAQGDYMTAVEIRKMAHSFMRKRALNQVDENHDNQVNGSIVVESFIARDDDPVYIAESWVVGIHVPSVDVWKRVKSGELNGFSIEALVKPVEQVLELEVPPSITGSTIKKDDQDHEHTYTVSFDKAGQFLGGRTSIALGHYHEIRKHTVTENANGHSHRYSFMEVLNDAQS